MAKDVIRADDFAFIDRIWADWSPGYDASEDLPKVKECIRDPAHFKAALGYYWGQFDPNRFGSEEWAAEQAAAWGQGHDPVHAVPAWHPRRLPRHDSGAGGPGAAALRPGSQSELIEGVGHFLMV
jgi:hypothetical protein